MTLRDEIVQIIFKDWVDHVDLNDTADSILALINEERCADIKDRISEICSSDLSVRNKVTEIIRAFDSQRCEWTMSPKDLEADKHRLFVGCRPNTIFPLSWDKIFPYCPCCGKRISVKE